MTNQPTEPKQPNKRGRMNTRLSNEEHVARKQVEEIAATLPHKPMPTFEAIREAAIARFTTELDNKMDNLQEEEYLQITFRIDILTPDRKVRTANKRFRNMPKYKEWRTAVFERDNYRCVKCTSNKKICAHHIEHWSKAPALRFVVDNGITLCNDCHVKEHPKLEKLIKTHGRKKNKVNTRDN